MWLTLVESRCVLRLVTCLKGGAAPETPSVKPAPPAAPAAPVSQAPAPATAAPAAVARSAGADEVKA